MDQLVDASLYGFQDESTGTNSIHLQAIILSHLTNTSTSHSLSLDSCLFGADVSALSMPSVTSCFVRVFMSLCLCHPSVCPFSCASPSPLSFECFCCVLGLGFYVLGYILWSFRNEKCPGQEDVCSDKCRRLRRAHQVAESCFV